MSDTTPEPGSWTSDIEAAVGRLDDLGDLDVADHAAVYDEVHAALHATLTSTDRDR